MGARILLIEDTQANLELMSYLLEAFGHRVTTALDGCAGLESARADPPDLILCDIHLPKMDGYEIAHKLKSDPALQRIPLVAVTALAMVGDREKILAAGFEGYVSKPIEPERFVAEIEVFVDGALHSAPREAPAPSLASEPAESEAKHAVLLVVDDSAVELSLMHSVFDPLGYDVRMAANLGEALQIARVRRPDLVVCDIKMPGGSGFDLLQRVKADPDLSALPVVLITSTTLSEADRTRALAGGALRVVGRPIEPQAFLAVVEECLATQRER